MFLFPENVNRVIENQAPSFKYLFKIPTEETGGIIDMTHPACDDYVRHTFNAATVVDDTLYNELSFILPMAFPVPTTCSVQNSCPVPL